VLHVLVWLIQKKKVKETELTSEITDCILCYGTINKSKRGLAVPAKGVVMAST